MTKRIFNFAAGPCTLPLPALERARDEFVDYQGAGMSLIEMSHRGKHYDQVHSDATQFVREVYGVPETHDILFLQGGATLQFAMVPLNLLAQGNTAEYINTGSWAKKALADAKLIGDTRVIWTGEEEKFTRVPGPDEIECSQEACYVHITTNETIGGIEFQQLPDFGSTPLVADMSSNILSKRLDFSQFGLIYAGAQKNLGPAGATLVIIRKDVLEKSNDNLPAYLSYKTHAPKNSLYNTPPVFAIYMMKLNFEWVKSVGGLEEMAKRATARSQAIYETIDESDGWYRCPVDRESRSRMNVCWRLPTEELEKKLIAQADETGMSGLKGHRSVGGCRASMYNAMPLEGAACLADFMVRFRKDNS